MYIRLLFSFSAAMRGVFAVSVVPVIPVLLILPVGVLSLGGVNTALPDPGLPTGHGDSNGDTCTYTQTWLLFVCSCVELLFHFVNLLVCYTSLYMYNVQERSAIRISHTIWACGVAAACTCSGV